jgi:hypothetical protein
MQNWNWQTKTAVQIEYGKSYHQLKKKIRGKKKHHPRADQWTNWQIQIKLPIGFAKLHCQ